ncbi:Enterobactin exporter EntS [Candidatus Entotheonellaceae bacterium PAL068K]
MLKALNCYLPSSMRYGHFRYYWLALLTGVTGHQMLLQFTMGWLMFDLTGEAKHLAFLGLAIAIPALVLNLLGGVLADRLEPKFLVAASQGTSASVVVVLAVLVLTDQVEVWHVLVTAVIIGAVQAFDQPSRSSVFPRLVQPQHIVSAVAMESIVWNVVRVLAPALAGIVIDRWSIHASMFFSAATFSILGSVVSVLRLRPRPPATGQVLHQIGESFRYVRRHPIFLYIMLLTFCNSLFGMAYILLMPVFAKDVLNVGAEQVGWLLGASGVGGTLGTWMIGSLREGHPKGLVMLGGAMVYGLALILFSLSAWQGMYGVCMGLLFVVGIANSLYLVGGLSTLQQLVPDQLRGRVMGLYGVTWSLAPLGMSQAGLIAQYLGAPVAVAAGAVVLVGVVVLIFALSPDVRALRVEVAEPARPASAGSAEAG